jgi:hypothetical protein
MDILSEEDFYRLKALGMLYVVHPESDGTYENYLKSQGVDYVKHFIVGKKEAVIMPSIARKGSNPLPPPSKPAPPMPFIKPPLGLRPKSAVNIGRMKEILEAMLRYTDAGKKIPVEWFGELDDLNEGLLK